MRFFELDLPATQQDKRDRLARLGVACPHVTYVAADFTRDDVAGQLAAAGHDRATASFFMCEGVTPYLEHPVVTRLLSALRTAAADGSRFALDVRVRDTDEGLADRARRAALDTALTAMGEPPQPGYGPDELEPLLAETGWQLVATYARRFLVADPLP